MLRTWRISLVAVVTLVASAREAAAIPSDDLLKSLHATADVNDFAGILSPAEKEAIEARCRQLRERTGAQLAVVTLKSLQGGNLEDFTNKLFQRWGIGQKDKKNGLLLLVAMEEHKSRIEVGYGLEPIIPDVLAGRIIDHQLRPQFRAGQYGAGLLAATNALIELVEKGQPADRAALAAKHGRFNIDTFGELLFLAMFVAVGGLIAGFGMESKEMATLMFGAMVAGVPMMIAIEDAGLWALIAHAPIALLTGLVGWISGKNSDHGGRKSRYNTGPGISGWIWGSPSSGGWGGGGWSGGGGGGGFSGGFGGFVGGSSGGGGASGGW